MHCIRGTPKTSTPPGWDPPRAEKQFFCNRRSEEESGGGNGYREQGGSNRTTPIGIWRSVKESARLTKMNRSEKVCYTSGLTSPTSRVSAEKIGRWLPCRSSGYPLPECRVSRATSNPSLFPSSSSPWTRIPTPEIRIPSRLLALL